MEQEPAPYLPHKGQLFDSFIKKLPILQLQLQRNCAKIVADSVRLRDVQINYNANLSTFSRSDIRQLPIDRIVK